MSRSLPAIVHLYSVAANTVVVVAAAAAAVAVAG